MKFPPVDYQLSYREMYDRWEELKTSLQKDKCSPGFVNIYGPEWVDGFNTALESVLDMMKELEE